MLSFKINIIFQKILYLILLLLQVNFFNLFGNQDFYQLNADNSKIIILFLVAASCVLWAPVAFSTFFKAKGYVKNPFNWLIISFLLCWVAVLFGSSSVYQISLGKTINLSYYYPIVAYFFPFAWLVKIDFSFVLKSLKIFAYIDLLFMLIQDLVLSFGGRLFLSLDPFGQQMFMNTGRIVAGTDFLLFACFVIILARKLNHTLPSYIEVVFFSGLVFHLFFFAKSRMILLLVVAIITVAIFFNSSKKFTTPVRLLFYSFCSVGILALMNMLIAKMSFFSGDRAASGQVRIQAITYYLNNLGLNKWFGFGFTPFFDQIGGGGQGVDGGVFYTSDVGMIGLVAIFGALGVFFVILFLLIFIRFLRSFGDFSVKTIVIVYIFGQWISLSSFDISRILIFPMALGFLIGFRDHFNLRDSMLKDS
ncbi:hypothetical protein AKG30_09740 [Lacticaseibacillus paracasei]|uniref:hypothetical protein n=1 Tax=Lacticaseibacillus paracasei TaxID=1597 RepID=UPI0006834DBC|nr:hypothetical protein [Lacticaseibacillus paracasei]AKU35221.1 hypothetical protein AKG30_09740 [Lacticaseibacillus paracasei]RNE10654.1 hypothetical protein FAM22280_01447 [Lacticaseibacillus paracasei]